MRGFIQHHFYIRFHSGVIRLLRRFARRGVFCEFCKTGAGFTIIELLVVVAIVAVLAGVAVAYINPAELYRQSRDSRRASDLAQLTRATEFARGSNSNMFVGSPQTVYVSLPDGDPECDSYALPTLPFGWEYSCKAAGVYQRADGSGWHPVNFSTGGQAFSTLPIDPDNDIGVFRYYTYVVDGGDRWEATAKFSSGKFAAYSGADGGTTSNSFEVGSDLFLTPLAVELHGTGVPVPLNNTWFVSDDFNALGTAFSAGMHQPSDNDEVRLGIASVAQGDWFDSAWQYRVPVTIDSSKIDGLLSDFPVLVRLTSTDINFGSVEDGGRDIRFTHESGSPEYNFEIESWDDSPGSEEVFVWVKIPTIDDAIDTTFHMYYGNPAAADTQTAPFIASVWDSSFSLVQHLEEAPLNGVPGGHGDSTNNGYNGVAQGFAGTPDSTTNYTGRIDGADIFDEAGGADYIDFGNVLDFDTTDSFSSSFWMRTTDTFGYVISKVENGGAFPGYRVLVLGTPAVLQVQLARDSATSLIRERTVQTVNDDAWHHIGVTYDGSGLAAGLRIFVDGVEGATTVLEDSLSGSMSTTAPFYVGVGYDGVSNPFLGSLDDIRVSDSVRLPEWMRATYENRDGALVSYGLEEERSALYYALDQTWTSEGLDAEDAGVGNTYAPQFLTVDWVLDGTDNTAPQLQVHGSPTGAFGGEETVYPGVGLFYEDGGVYDINDAVARDLSGEIATPFRFWRVRTVLNTGADQSDTPRILRVTLTE
jgi:prepilin-type N-terminal cleavage/methylation domain-containing protein